MTDKNLANTADGIKREPPKNIKPRGRKRLHPQWRDHLVYAEANITPAPLVLAEALGLTFDQAIAGLRALSKEGYAIAPRIPTNSMLAAYCYAYGSPPQRVEGVMVQLGKARKRWRAMAAAGTRVALSRRARAGLDE